MWDAYTWIFGMSVVLALFVAWGIGANDVSNAFGTSVGAKALTLKQAIIVASFCEFGGAVLLGSGVTDTIKSGIAKVDAYIYEPDILMYGMMCSLAAAGLWLLLATFLELPVSTTHSIVGAIIGMSMVAAGTDSVIWTSPAKPGSPFPGGVVSIVLAWFITPTMAALVAGLLFLFTKLVVLHAKDPFKRSLMLFPLYTFITVWVIVYFTIQKGVNGWLKAEVYGSGGCPALTTAPAKSYKLNADGSVKSVSGCTVPDSNNAWLAAAVAAGCTLFCIAFLKVIKRWVEADVAKLEETNRVHAERLAAKEAGTLEAGTAAIKAGEPVVLGDTNGVDTAVTDGARPPARNLLAGSSVMHRSYNAFTRGIMYGSNVDVHDVIDTDEKIRDLHAEAEVFDVKSEGAFKYLQVMTACANSFAHGANDVANAIGSMAAVYSIWQCQCANSKANVPIWMFVIGGVGLVLGLSTYGYKIIRVMGVKMTRLTNSRGYCAELTAAIIVIVASRYGFPVSTTQVITGAITGIGISEVISAKLAKKPNAYKAFNWLLLLKFFGGWVATLVVAGLTSALFTAQGIYSPSKGASQFRSNLNTNLNTTNVGMMNTLLAAGNVTAPTPAQQQAFAWGQELNTSIKAWTTSGGGVLDTNIPMDIFQTGSWYLGNASLAGALANTFMPDLPPTAGSTDF